MTETTPDDGGPSDGQDAADVGANVNVIPTADTEESTEQPADEQADETIKFSLRGAIRRAIGTTFRNEAMLGFFLLGSACLGVLSLMANQGVRTWWRAILFGSIAFLFGQFCYVCGLQYLREGEDRPDGLSGVLYAGFLRSFPWTFLLVPYLAGLGLAAAALVFVPPAAFFLGLGVAYLGLYLLPAMVGYAVRPADRASERITAGDVVGDNRAKVFGFFVLVWLVATPLSVVASLSDLAAIVANPALGLVNGVSLAALGFVYLDGTGQGR